MHKATFSPLGLAVYEPSSHQPQRGWPSQHARRPSDPKGLTECFSAVAFCCRNPLKGDWPRYALRNPQPLRGWRRSVAAILNPFGVGLATRCTTLNPFRGWRRSSAAILNPGGVGLRYALRQVKPRKQLLRNSFRGLKRQTVFRSGRSTVGTARSRAPHCGRLRRTDSPKNYFFLFISFTCHPTWAASRART